MRPVGGGGALGEAPPDTRDRGAAESNEGRPVSPCVPLPLPLTQVPPLSPVLLGQPVSVLGSGRAPCDGSAAEIRGSGSLPSKVPTSR